MKQDVFRRAARRVHRRLNAAATRRDLLVSRSLAALLEFIDARAAKDRVRVRIDEARQNNTASGIDHFGVVLDERFDLGRLSDSLDQSIANEHSSVRDDAQLAQFRTDTCPRWSSKRHHLRTIDDGERLT